MTVSEHPSIISLATPTILLLPIQPISKQSFDRIVKTIRTFSTQQNNKVLLNFRENQFYSQSGIYHNYLHTLQPNRKPFGIIGIVDCSNWPTLNDAIRSFELLLATHHPRTPVGRCFGFHSNHSQVDNLDGVIVIPQTGDQSLHLQALMADFTADLIRSFNHLSTVLQSTSSLETPRKSHNSTLFDSIPILPPLRTIIKADQQQHQQQLDDQSMTSSVESIPIVSSKLVAPKARQPMAYMLSEMKRAISPPTTHPEDHQAIATTITNRLLNSTGNENRNLNSFSPPPIDSRVRKKHIGRIKKLEADLELLAAKPIDALRIYNEAIGHLKLVNDLVWWAAALEGLAVSKMLALLTSLAINQNTVDEILADLELSIEIYSKTLSKNLDGNLVNGNLESVDPLVFVESVIRLIDFKLELIEFRTLKVDREDREILRILLGNHLARTNRKIDPNQIPVESRIELNRIGSMVELAVDGLRFGEDRIKALSKLVGLFERIGFRRKSAWFKRELVGVIVEQIAQFRASLPPDGKHELVKLIEEVCSTFRVPIDQHRHHQPILIDNRLKGSDQQGAWKELQIGVLMDAVITSYHLEDQSSELMFRLILNQTLEHHQQQQNSFELEIKDDDRRINSLFKSLSHNPKLHYWGPREIILTLEVIPLSTRHSLIPYIKRPILLPTTCLNNLVPGTSALPTFYYNHHNRTPTGLAKDFKDSQLKFVKDEPLNVFVTLQNPMSIDLEIRSIWLSTTGIEFKPQKSSTSIKSKTIKTISLTGTPLSSGKLYIKGCWITLIGCHLAQEFILPIGKPKFKKNELEDLLSCEVINGVPFFRILNDSDSIDGSCSDGVLVYDGEVLTIEIKIMNTSHVKADWIDVRVEDSLSTTMRKKLEILNSNEKLQTSTNNQTLVERYEIEFELINRPVLSVTYSDTIESHQIGFIKVKCLGKVGCRSIGLRIDYGADSGLNLKRSLDWNIGLSVLKSLEVVGFHSLKNGFIVIHVRNYARGGQVFQVEAKGGKASSHAHIKESQTHIIHPGSTHAFLIEIEPIHLSQLDSEKSIPNLIDRQFVLKPHHPSILGEVDPSRHRKRLSLKQESVNQDLLKFWIKDKLLNTIKLEWREVGTNKTGEISLRDVSVDQQMVDNLRSHEVSVHLDLITDLQDHRPPSPGNRKTSIEIDQFYSIAIKIKNQSGMKRKIDCMVKVMGLDGKIIPSSSSTSIPYPESEEMGESSLSSIYLIEGLLQDQPNQSQYGGIQRVTLDENYDLHTIEFKICFLSRGQFLIQALVFDALQSLSSTPSSSDNLGYSEPVHLIVS
ncbi:hypothetical protein MJO28_005250 [Puccinia striiformis f. sp. tritici]|uniref:Uncharacterized protein n=3 Tax=Puccinia striiformis f. sp. tritici TaxID=168172 RepID=A0A0L0URA5_9BASI|nr:hypothetical protein Pst134EA_009421 [Puccinia striiformis f. sp. tritici]KNE89485.1 hypothetical protein PSTG_17059 [Puccinia striiformis f. sp. tritici PST-78]KAH9458183.1 hypothetical protein Pst134EB_010485 [Puccinia striiformis f. sp. tritici]KAH9468893.1 hypothetical protein Pst134EA_009421 [Puccinia striiformis f. sp. tritici]KAI7954850.1 hypothetical protein MJO28_005250 [Puccinia striiformis f. sp. tritici]KAI7960232.1 hypothetical protein MJO29_005300 [Puccinia striiformis f. sp. 